jgi:thioesterase domain-containing protein
MFPGPGRSSRVRSIAALAKKMLEFMDDKELNDGIVVGGYSFGALLAREAAVILQDRGMTVSGVMLLDPPDPGRHHIRKSLRWSRWRPSLVSGILALLPAPWMDAFGGILRLRFSKEIQRHREEQRRFLMRNYRPSVSGALREILVTSQAEHQGSVQLFSRGISNTEIVALPVTEHLEVLTEPTARMLWFNKLKNFLGDSQSSRSV